MSKKVLDKGKEMLKLSRVLREPTSVSRVQNSTVLRQLDGLRAHYGDKVTCHLTGIDPLSLNHKRQHPGCWRAVQFLYALTFHAGERVTLLDIVTSFRFRRTPQQIVKSLDPSKDNCLFPGRNGVHVKQAQALKCKPAD